MGHINPEAPWDHIGALDPSRVEVHRTGWMLPSSHLILRESPQSAAQRVLREQLEIENLELSEPKVVSEVYRPRRFPKLPEHWDIELIFKGRLGKNEVPAPRAWTELKFIDLRVTSKTDIARSHEDILEYAGLKFGQM